MSAELGLKTFALGVVSMLVFSVLESILPEYSPIIGILALVWIPSMAFIMFRMLLNAITKGGNQRNSKDK